MDDKEIIINVYRSFMNANRYIIQAKYVGIEHIEGTGYAENDFISKLRGRSLEDEIKKATCDAIKDLKNEYDNCTNEREHIEFIKMKSQSYVKGCIGDDIG
jgi:hypothetical protein